MCIQNNYITDKDIIQSDFDDIKEAARIMRTGHKNEKPRKRNISGTSLYNLYFRILNPRLANTLSKHCLNNFLKSGNISACYIVALNAVSLRSVIDIVVNCNHNILKLGVNLLKAP